MKSSEYSLTILYKTFAMNNVPGKRAFFILAQELIEPKFKTRPQPNWKLYGNPRSNGLRNNNDGDEYQVAVANGVFVQQGFSIRPDYLNAVTSVYKSSMKNLDFARDGVHATKYINE